MRLANLTWPKVQEYFEKNDMVLVSIGSIECHGRHMPLGTDTLIPEHLLEKIEQKSDVLIAPTIPYGACQSLPSRRKKVRVPERSRRKRQDDRAAGTGI